MQRMHPIINNSIIKVYQNTTNWNERMKKSHTREKTETNQKQQNKTLFRNTYTNLIALNLKWE